MKLFNCFIVFLIFLSDSTNSYRIGRIIKNENQRIEIHSPIKRNLFWSQGWGAAGNRIYHHDQQRQPPSRTEQIMKKEKSEKKEPRKNPFLKWTVPGLFGEF